MRLAKLSVGILAVAASFLMLNTSSAIADAPTSTLSVYYNGYTGALYISNRLSRIVSGTCRIRVVGGVSYNADDNFTGKRTLLDKRFKRRRIFQFLLSDIKGVSNNDQSELPIFSVQTRVVCNGGEVDVVSNSAARYVNCGVGRHDVSATEFLRSVGLKLKDAASTL